MPKQDLTIPLTAKQKEILDLEEKYFDKLNEVIYCDEFKDDLLLIEKEIRENYAALASTWDLLNKLKVPAERLVRHYIYMKWHSIIESVYPSPVSSDLGIKTSDAVICIDIKTIETEGNAGDLRSTCTEKNQNSFNNKNYPGFEFKSNLKSIDHYSSRPVLTYIVKIVYTDDKYSFKLSRSPYPTLVTACIPNGELSNLFQFNIIDNFKTYDYFGEKDGLHFKPFNIPPSAFVNKTTLKAFLDAEFIISRHFSDVSMQMGKPAYYDVANHCVWWLVKSTKKAQMCALKSGSSVRYNNEILKDRYDSHGNNWTGYKDKIITEVLP